MAEVCAAAHDLAHLGETRSAEKVRFFVTHPWTSRCDLDKNVQTAHLLKMVAQIRSLLLLTPRPAQGPTPLNGEPPMNTISRHARRHLSKSLSRRLNLMIALPLSAAAIATLVACGGGGGGTASSSNGTAVAMSTYITDAVSDDYSQVWVGVLKITAVDSTGAEVTLFSADTPQVYNLSSLDSVGQLMAAATIPSGTYRAVKVTLADDVSLVKVSDGSTVPAYFNGDGSTKTIRVEVEYNAAAENALVLDFDLQRFTTVVNASGKTIVQPVILKRAKGDLKDFIRNQAEVHGTVTAISGNSLTINDRRLGNGVVVTLATDGVVVDEATRSTVALSSITVGSRIEAKGVITSSTDTTTATVAATVIKVESSSSGSVSDDASNRARGEGTVVSYDAANKLLTLALAEASFLPSSQQVVVDLTNARYAHGTVADLTAGTVVTFKGALNTAASPTSDVLARVVDVEGAASSSSNSGNALSEVNGTITAVSGTTVTLNTSSGVITVNTSGALVKEGKASCLAVGGTLEAKGTLSGSTLTARVLEVSGGGCVDNRRHR
jgi:hypothetical protein